MEYVIGLELLRPVFFFIVLSRMEVPWKKAIRQSLLKWIPYLLVLCIFFYYRFVYFPHTNADPEANAPLLLREIFSNPLVAIPHLVQNIMQDSFSGFVVCLGKPIIPTEIDFSQTTNWFALLIGLSVAIAAVFLLRSNGKPQNNDHTNITDDRFAVQAMLVGLAAVVLGGLPVWSTDRQIIVGMWSDRFSLGLMFGVAILLTGLASWLSQKLPNRGVPFCFCSPGCSFSGAKHRQL